MQMQMIGEALGMAGVSGRFLLSGRVSPDARVLLHFGMGGWCGVSAAWRASLRLQAAPVFLVSLGTAVRLATVFKLRPTLLTLHL